MGVCITLLRLIPFNHYFLSRYNLAALSASTIRPFYPLSTLFDDTQESTLSSTTEEVITSLNSTDVPCPLESPPPETMPRSPTTGHTAQVFIDAHYFSITEPSTGTVKAEENVEDASSAMANACMLKLLPTSCDTYVLLMVYIISGAHE